MSVISDLCYGDAFEPRHRLDLYLPQTDHFKVFVYFHGGGLENGDKSAAQAFAPYLCERGIAVASANYRMYPSAAYPDFIRDAARAAAWVKQHIGEYGKCEEVFIGGSSAGGYLSMMLCFDKRWFAPYKLAPEDFAGYIHDAGQSTSHFNVLRERGIDSRRVIVDDTAPLYHIGKAEKYAPMLLIVSDDDMENRYEQTMLVCSTMKHFRQDACVKLQVMHGRHCAYVRALDENGQSVFGRLCAEFIQ